MEMYEDVLRRLRHSLPAGWELQYYFDNTARDYVAVLSDGSVHRAFLPAAVYDKVCDYLVWRRDNPGRARYEPEPEGDES